MYSLTSPTIAAERREEALKRTAQTRLVREIRLGAHSAARPAVRPATARSFRRYLRPRASRAAA